ncbi:S8 family serine peptidase [Kribbella sp. NPDC050820]|uniref:S8 family peptidase n=1 Tax=Kribbella sp. NPDC050820 TaxID=3155408 RepID=UPI0033D9F4B6
MPRSRLSAALVAAATAAVLAMSAVTTTAAAPPPPPGQPGSPLSAQTYRITLVTGDVAEYTTQPGGRHSARLLGNAGYFTSENGGELTVVPAAAYRHVQSGTVDPRLFNLTQLVAQGYDDAHTKRLPVIDAEAEKSQARGFWKSFAAKRSPGKLWLDARTRAATTSPTGAQAKAAQARGSQYDGSGVKVAVLSTGYDARHPDLANQVVAEASFFPGESVQDGHGAGTATASVIAGIGSVDRSRKGVAPGADLIVGKVLDNTGSGTESEAIAGIEWAVEQGARVINLGLSSSIPSDGTDPLSQTIDRLSKSKGVLFVVPAGDSGREEFIGFPAAAGTALTVSSVDADGNVSSTASRGLRVDGALKPEVTALGVNVEAARATGTNAGHNLSEHYTSMNGTAMAAAEAAGVAAQLAQRHPDWTGAQLKAALAGTARPARDEPIVAQGLGRIDADEALDSDLTSDLASLSFGDLSWSGEAPPPVERQVTYTNTGRKTVTLDLALDLVTPNGIRPALTVSPSRLRLAPGQSGTATVRLDLAKTKTGTYSGTLRARSGNTSYRTGIGFKAGGPLQTLTVHGIDRDGQPVQSSGLPASSVALWNLDSGKVQEAGFVNGTATLAAPAGRYSLFAFVFSYDEAEFVDTMTLVGEPELRLDGDRAVTLDARRAHEVQVNTPQPADVAMAGLAWSRKLGDRSAFGGWAHYNYLDRVYVQDFDRVRTGSFEVIQRWNLRQPLLTADVTGPDGYRLPSPLPVTYRKAFQGNADLAVVDGGEARPGELDQVAGKVVMIRQSATTPVDEQLNAAAAAGARFALLYRKQGGYYDPGTSAELPGYALESADAFRLLDRLQTGPVTLRVSGIATPTYRYDLSATPSEVRGPLRYDFAKLRPTVVTNTFNVSNVTEHAHVNAQTAYPSTLSVGYEVIEQIENKTTRTDYLASDEPETQWTSSLIGGFENATGQEYTLPRTYRKGEHVTQQWWRAISRPAVPAVDGMGVARYEDAIRMAIPQYVSGDLSTYGWSDDWREQTMLVLRRNGIEVGRKNWSVADFPVAPGTASYELSLDVTRTPNTWADTSTSTSTQWSFRSGTAKSKAVLPLVQVEYALQADSDNAVPAAGGSWLELTPGYQPSANGPGRFRTTAEVSYDGKTWQPLSLVYWGHGTVGAKLPAATAGTDATLRVTSTDRAGNRIVQRIDKAWHVR